MECPTIAQIRAEAIDTVSLDAFNKKGKKADGLAMIAEVFLQLMFRYFPHFCELARVENLRMIKELNDTGYKTPTRMIAGKVYEGSSGWSKDGLFRHKWIIPNQLLTFMRHIDRDFWGDSNAKTRDKFMKGVLKGQDYYQLLDEVYKKYGSNNIQIVTAEDKQALGIS